MIVIIFIMAEIIKLSPPVFKDTISVEEAISKRRSVRNFQHKPLTLVITAIYSRTTSHYGNRGIRYVDMEAGHVGQNVSLMAVSMGLGSVMIGAFSDSEVSSVLQLSKENIPLYIIPIGYPTPNPDIF